MKFYNPGKFIQVSFENNLKIFESVIFFQVVLLNWDETNKGINKIQFITQQKDFK